MKRKKGFYQLIGRKIDKGRDMFEEGFFASEREETSVFQELVYGSFMEFPEMGVPPNG